MTQHPDRMTEEALDWLVKTNDPAFDDWDGFTAWLERDSANADAYHRLSDSEALLTPVVAQIAPPLAPREPARRRWAIAAGIAAFGALTLAVVPSLTPTEYETAPGEIRTIALSDQDELVMNGATRIQLAGFDRRSIRVEQGQLLLRLNDRGEGPVEVRAGDLSLVDVGTVFEVSRDGNATRVLVSEGEVMADPRGARLRLAGGQRLDAKDGDALLRATPSLAASVGAWQHGQLAYVDEPLDRVAADLSRSTGIDFSASPAMGTRQVSATLSIAEVKRDPHSLGPLLGVDITPSGKGWRLGERS